MKMSEAEKFEVRLQVLARGVQLHEENERLKLRLKRKARMARHWRKSFMDLYKATTLKDIADKVKAKSEMRKLEASVG